MKKRILFAATALFTVSALAMLTGCGEATGEVKGKYKEATPEEVAAACAKVDFDKAFGDFESADWGMNLQTESETKAKLDVDMNVKAEGMTTNIKCKLDASENTDYLVSYVKNGDALSAYGAGSFKAKSEGDVTMSSISMSLDYDEEWKLYHDGASIYIDPVKTSKIFLTKSKISLDDVTDSDIPGFPETPDLPTDIEKPEDIKEGIDALIEKGAKISLDQRNGLKMKFTIGKEAAQQLTAQLEGQKDFSVQFEYRTFEVDVYLSFDEDGMFEAAGVVFDIDMSVSFATTEFALGGSLVLEGGYSVKATDSAAKLPAGIANDTEYVPFDPEALLGGLIGAGSSGGLF